jgi:NAD(P)-dependent dehydrogenase (short-subunit alcohol dehydrogenase family)
MAGLDVDADIYETLERGLGAGFSALSDVVGAVVLLASDQAALVTGHILAVDGGWTAW